MSRRTKSDLIASLDTFTLAYIECALWSSTDNADESGGEPLDRNYEIADIALDTLASMAADCSAFQDSNASDLATWGDEQAGHDFWLTRNGHGAGFWDRGRGAIGERLSVAARAYGSVDLYVARGRVHS